MIDSKQRKIGVTLSYVSIFLSVFVQLLYTPFLLRMIGQSEYGLYSLITSIIGYLTIFDLGFGNAIIVYASKYHAQGDIDSENKLFGMFRIVFYLIGFITLLLGILLFLNINNIFGSTMNNLELNKLRIMLLILSINIAITFFLNIYSSIIIAYEKFVFQKIISILNTLLKPILMIPLLFLGYKSITMCMIIAVVNVMVVLSNYFYCKYKLNIKIKYSGFDTNLFKIVFGYSIWIFLGTIVDKINWSVDQFVLGAVSGTIAVSIYSIASQINMLFINLSTAISGVMLPKITKMIANKATNEDLTNEFVKVGRLQHYIIFMMVTLFILLGKNFIILWVGKEFEIAYYVTLILIIPISFPLIQNLAISIMQAKNKFKFKSITTFVMAIFNVLISIYLAKKYGPIGSAIGTGISLIVCNIFVINIYYYKVIKLNVFRFWKEIFFISLPLIINFFIFKFITGFFDLNNPLCLLFITTLYVISHSFFVYFGSMNLYEKNLVNSFICKVRRKSNEGNSCI